MIGDKSAEMKLNQLTLFLSFFLNAEVIKFSISLIFEFWYREGAW